MLVKDTDSDGYGVVRVDEIDLTEQEDLSRIYGLFTSRSKARNALEETRRTYQLCPKLLGLEQGKGACFLYQLGKCSGACASKESKERYNLRLELALEHGKLERWPFKGAVAVSEDDQEFIVLDKWVVIGYIHVLDQGEPDYRPVERRFDVDTYRILRSYIKSKRSKLKILPFDPAALSAI